MNIQIQTIHFTVEKELIDLIKKKIKKLSIIDNQLISAKVFLKFTKSESYQSKIIEIGLHSAYAEFFAKKQSNSFEASADLASQALRKQIIKNKEK